MDLSRVLALDILGERFPSFGDGTQKRVLQLSHTVSEHICSETCVHLFLNSTFSDAMLVARNWPW